MKNNKKIILILLVVVFILGLIVFIFLKNKEIQGSDFKIGILADDGIALVSISKERKMINVLKVDPEAKIWIPGGLSWYRNITLKKILYQEKKVELLSDIIFFNFGYKADKLLYLKKADDWKNIYWWKLAFYNNFLVKEEVVKKDIDLSDDFLDEVIVRDFAETKVIYEDIKLSIINTTDVTGLAAFMTKRFERLGFSVVSIGNDFSNQNKNCQIRYSKDVSMTYSLFLIKKIITNCETQEDFDLNGNEIEIYFDSSFSRMIEYPSYIK